MHRRRGRRSANASWSASAQQVEQQAFCMTPQKAVFVGKCTRERPELSTTRPSAHLLRSRHGVLGQLVSGRLQLPVCEFLGGRHRLLRDRVRGRLQCVGRLRTQMYVGLPLRKVD